MFLSDISTLHMKKTTSFGKPASGYPVARRRSASDNKYRIAFNDALLTSYTSP
jgi:hypothetical protein